MSHYLLPSVVVLLLFHVVGLLLLLRNLRWLRWLPEDRPLPERNYAVTVIVPARNEEADIAGCLRSLLGQEKIDLRIVVVNDHSEDDTGRIANGIAAEDSRVTVIHDPPLRSGWLGKHNAMQSALEHADTAFVLFTDADVIFQPPCLSTAIAELEAHKLDLLSIYPRFQFVSFCETMLVPIYVAGTALLLSPSVVDGRSRHAMAVGAFILVRSAAIQAVGGFASLKAEILDDVGLARTFKQHGFAIGLRSAPDLMCVRFFKGNRHAFWGVTKHLLGLVQRFIWVAPFLALAPAVMYGALLTGLAYGLWRGDAALALLSFITLAIHYGALLLTRRSNSFSALKALAFPAMSVSFACSCCRAIYLFVVKGDFHWRGRALRIRRAK
jgi:glycosyltransferase involved in cell wall biosynthesis